MSLRHDGMLLKPRAELTAHWVRSARVPRGQCGVSARASGAQRSQCLAESQSSSGGSPRSLRPRYRSGHLRTRSPAPGRTRARVHDGSHPTAGTSAAVLYRTPVEARLRRTARRVGTPRVSNLTLAASATRAGEANSPVPTRLRLVPECLRCDSGNPSQARAAPESAAGTGSAAVAMSWRLAVGRWQRPASLLRRWGLGRAS